MKLLFITPTPPDRSDRDGMTQIAQALIAELGPRHQIDVWTLSTESEQPSIPGAHQVRVFPSTGHPLLSHYLSGSRAPFFQARHESPLLHQQLRQLPPSAYDLVVLHSPFVAHYLSDVSSPTVVHIMDSMSVWFKKTADQTPPPKKWHLQAEARKAAAMERSLQSARAVTTVSEIDSAALQTALPHTKIVAIPIGLDGHTFFPPIAPRLPATVVMTGIMDYPPNVDAAEFFARRAWPSIRQKLPQAELRIVGKNPTSTVRDLQTIPGVTVTGRVPSVADELRQATIAVSPLRFGTGYKIKINEALACGTPLIASPASLPGTGAKPGITCLVAEQPAEWISATVKLLSDTVERELLSQAGLAFARTRTWTAVAKQYESVYTEACEK